MDKLIEYRIEVAIGRVITTALKRDLDEDTYLSFESKELKLFIASTLIQVLAQPFVADVYQHVKDAILEKGNDYGVVLKEEDTRKMFDDTYRILATENKIDESWTINWKPDEK